MSKEYVDVETVSDLHHLYGLSGPKHPLISVIELDQVNRVEQITAGVHFRMALYTIFFKRFEGLLKYGKSHYDFDDGSLMFTAPYQVIAASPGLQVEEGWGLVFHPDLLVRAELGRRMSHYSFFQYDANEALHVSDEEKQIIKDCIHSIKREYCQPIDKHSQGLIQNNVELLLNYCNRFYDRQFFTRTKISNDLVQRFEKVLVEYFSENNLIVKGLPDVKYFASTLNLSPNYLSDLLKKYTGKTTQEHIHLQVIDKAKLLLWGSDKSISEIAYGLGFEHPSHFTKIFKTKTGKSPSEFRHSN